MHANTDDNDAVYYYPLSLPVSERSVRWNSRPFDGSKTSAPPAQTGLSPAWKQGHVVYDLTIPGYQEIAPSLDRVKKAHQSQHSKPSLGKKSQSQL